MEGEEATSIHRNINLKPEDFLDTCRVCMDRHEEMNSIFDSKNDSVVDRVQFCTGIQITIDDSLPTQICNACIQNLTIAHKFKTSCLQSDELFRKILQDNIKEEPVDYFNYLLHFDDDDDDEVDDKIKVKEVKEEVLENVSNENVRKTRVRLKKEETESTVVKEIKQQKKTKGPYKKPGKPKRVKKFKFKRLYCEPCDMKFKTKLESEEHNKLAHEDASWVCEVCGKIFTNQATHYQHMKRHMPNRYECEQCGYKTPHKCHLVKHLRVHSGQKLYQCDICSSRFRSSSTLNGHIRRFHEGQTRYKCTMCDKRFYERTKLNRHIDSHNNVKRFECEVCHSCFTRRCYWKKHLVTRHGVVIPAQRPGRRRLDDQIEEFTANNGTIARLLAKQSLATDK